MKQEREKYIIENYMSSERYGVIHENEIPMLSLKFAVTETTIKKDLRELNCTIFKSKPSKLKDLVTYKPILEGLKLKFGTRMPKYLHNKSVRSLVGQNLWGKVRSLVSIRNNKCCSICGYTTDTLTRLHVHEEWEVDEDNLIIKLVDLSFICIHCHSLQHWENTYYRTAEKGEWDEVRFKLYLHFMKVNECTQEILIASLRNSRGNVMHLVNSIEPSRQYVERMKYLNNAKWSYFIYEGMPLREEVIQSLEKKVNVL